MGPPKKTQGNLPSSRPLTKSHLLRLFFQEGTLRSREERGLLFKSSDFLTWRYKCPSLCLHLGRECIFRRSVLPRLDAPRVFVDRLFVTLAGRVRCVLSPSISRGGKRGGEGPGGDPGPSPIRRLIFPRKGIPAAPQTPAGQDPAGAADSCLDSERDEQGLRLPP